MYYCLYEIRNVLNDKIYVGVHKTKNIDDGYMGSGKVIRNAIKKHGSENFTKVILETFDDSESMYAREKEVVTDEFLDREDTYNLRRGGTGGFDYINKNIFSSEERAVNGSKGGLLGGAILKAMRESDPTLDKKMRLQWSLNRDKSIKSRAIKYPNGTWHGKTHTEETKNKLSEKGKRYTGVNNPQFGKCWVNNTIENKMIKKDDLQKYVDEGYTKGRQCASIL